MQQSTITSSKTILTSPPPTTTITSVTYDLVTWDRAHLQKGEVACDNSKNKCNNSILISIFFWRLWVVMLVLHTRIFRPKKWDGL